ncbi:MAG: DsbA family protein [Gemmatimonas sp.]
MAQGQRKKSEGTANRNASGNSPARSSSSKSRVPFWGLMLAIIAGGAGGIYYKMQSAPKPIVLSETAVTPKADGYLLGDPNAPVTIIEFADFECEQCANFSAVTEPDVRKRLIETGMANMRFYDFPLTEMHPNTTFASLAASCAADQDKFWPMHDVLLSRQSEWEGHTKRNANPLPQFERYAKEVGVDIGKYNTCMDSRENVARIQAHFKAGLDFQVPATPSFVIGGTLYRGNQTFDRIKTLVEAEAAKVQAKAGAEKDSAKE